MRARRLQMMDRVRSPIALDTVCANALANQITTENERSEARPPNGVVQFSNQLARARRRDVLRAICGVT